MKDRDAEAVLNKLIQENCMGDDLFPVSSIAVLIACLFWIIGVDHNLKYTVAEFLKSGSSKFGAGKELVLEKSSRTRSASRA
ncbi:hypothetical protein NL676_003730 [Syzygium grande]|nr:hypothetical protein NL676_003730 [Syzygium grande]